MIALIQRVTQASVTIIDEAGESEPPRRIGPGLLALVCAERDDTEQQADRLLDKVIDYRVFGDEHGKMNLSLRQRGGELLIVSQFTLAADTHSGTRPSFSPAAEPVLGRRLYHRFVERARAAPMRVQTGEFGARMQVALVNDGPVTFWLRVDPPPR